MGRRPQGRGLGIALLVLAPARGSLLRPPVELLGVIPSAVLAIALVASGGLRAASPATAATSAH